MMPELPPRPVDGHKGTFGRVLVVAGSTGMSGAACLSATAALRSGAGLVMAAVPQTIQSIVASFEPSYTTFGLACGADGQLQPQAVDEVLQFLPGRDAVAVGPGLGQGPAAVQLVRQLIQHVQVPLLLDADALNIVAAEKLMFHRSAATIITPHPGEFARLTARDSVDIHCRRVPLAEKYSEQQSCVTVLKGAGTVVTDGCTTTVNTTGNSGMATGGTGDVLTGVIVGLCAQGMEPLQAAVTGVYAHGLAGDLAAASSSQQGLIASDLLQWLPHVWSDLAGGNR